MVRARTKGEHYIPTLVREGTPARQLKPYTMARQILLVEDSANDAALVLAALEENNVRARVTVVRDGSEALDYLYGRGEHEARDGELPALVLLDLKLPKLSGLEVLQRVKEDPRLRLLPVVMLTSSQEHRDVARSYELGVNAYVVKPIDFHEFTTAMRHLGHFWLHVNEAPPA